MISGRPQSSPTPMNEVNRGFAQKNELFERKRSVLAFKRI